MTLATIRKVATNTWALVTVVAVIVGLIAGYFALRPHLTVSAKSVIDNANPFSVALEITNQSYFTLHHVEQKCEVLYATLHGYLIPRTLNSNLQLVTENLEPDHPATSFCNIDITTPPNMDAEIQVTISYPFLTQERSEAFRFVYRQGSNGLFWFPSPD